MFNFYGKGRCIKTIYEGQNHEVILFEDVHGEKLVIHLGKDFEKYDLIKSGEWIITKLRAQAKAKINRKGEIFFNTMITPDKSRELTDKEQRNLRQEIIDNAKEVEKILRSNKAKMDEKREIAEMLKEEQNEQVGLLEDNMKGEF